MCHIEREVFSAISSSNHPALRGMDFTTIKKLKSRPSPFKRMAKSVKINLNKYWGLLAPKKSQSPSPSSPLPSPDYSEAEEENRQNELLEMQCDAEEENSINSEIEEESSPELPRRFFVRQKALSVYF